MRMRKHLLLGLAFALVGTLPLSCATADDGGSPTIVTRPSGGSTGVSGGINSGSTGFSGGVGGGPTASPSASPSVR